MRELRAENIRERLRTSYIGQNVLYYPSVGSTQEIAARRANNGAPEGTLVIADEQTAGRGRLDRSWFAPRGSSLLFSLIFRPQIPVSHIHQMTMLCSLAVADAIAELYALQPGVKWPNDIYLNGKKLGGILTTASFTNAEPDYIIVGIGLNINLNVATLPPLMAPAISLSEVLEHPIPRLPLLQRILENVERRYNQLREGESPHHEWAKQLVFMHQHICVTTSDGAVTGTAQGVDETGALLLQDKDGDHLHIIAGDVNLSVEHKA